LVPVSITSLATLDKKRRLKICGSTPQFFKNIRTETSVSVLFYSMLLRHSVVGWNPW